MKKILWLLLTVSLAASSAQYKPPSGIGSPPTGACGGDLSGTFPNCTVAKINGSTPAAIATSGSATDLGTGTVPAARLPTPTASTLGGIQSIAAVVHKVITSITTAGVAILDTLSSSDLSDTANIPLLNTANIFTQLQTANNGFTAKAPIILKDSTDPTKIVSIGMATITTGTTRNLTFPNAAGALMVDVSQATNLVPFASSGQVFTHDANFSYTTAGGLKVPQITSGGASLTVSSGEVGMSKISASGVAPGAGGCKEEWVCGMNAGTAKKIAYCGTSTTPTTIVDNVGSGVTGC